MGISLEKLALSISAELKGDPWAIIETASGIDNANDSSITYFDNGKQYKDLNNCPAGAVILRECDQHLFDGNRLLHPAPRAAYALVADQLHGEKDWNPGIHPSARIADSAHIDSSACVSAFAVVDDEAKLGRNVFIGPHSYIGKGVFVGDATSIQSQTSIQHDCIVGSDCEISDGVIIGSDGFGYEWFEDNWIKIPQLGGVRIGNRVHIGAGTTIDRGSSGDTVIKDDVKLDNQIQIAHNVRIGEKTIMAGCVAVAGSARIGKRCRFGGRASILGHLEITDDVQISACSVVTRSLLKAGVYSSTLAVQPHEQWLRTAAHIRKFDSLLTKIKTALKLLK